MTVSAISWRVVETAADLREHLRLRRDVFVIEQRVPLELEIDEADVDPRTIVFNGYDEAGRAVATGRIPPVTDGVAHLGRLAVDADWRGKGIGTVLVAYGEQLVATETGATRIELSAQEYAIGFYEAQGYRLVPGESYLDAGIRHRDMVKDL